MSRKRTWAAQSRRISTCQQSLHVSAFCPCDLELYTVRDVRQSTLAEYGRKDGNGGGCNERRIKTVRTGPVARDTVRLDHHSHYAYLRWILLCENIKRNERFHNTTPALESAFQCSPVLEPVLPVDSTPALISACSRMIEAVYPLRVNTNGEQIGASPAAFRYLH